MRESLLDSYAFIFLILGKCFMNWLNSRKVSDRMKYKVK